MGAAVGRGRYIKVLQDDDYLLPGGLKALIDLAESTECYWAYGAANRVDNDDVFMSVNRPEVNGNLFAHSAVGDAFHLSASLIRRDIFFQVGGFDPTINTSEDIDLQWRIARLGEIRGTSEIVAGIRVGVWGGTTTNWNKKTMDTRIVRERALNSPGAFTKMWDSVKGDSNLRGRCSRAYLISGVLNLAGFRIPLAVSRFFFGLLMANVFVLLPKFWKGLLSRSHWHRHEKNKEEQHYLDLHPEQEIKSQKW
jgi:GT2 family glycosyltransferase